MMLLMLLRMLLLLLRMLLPLLFPLQAEDKFFDPDDMEKFADEDAMDDDLEGESCVSLKSSS